MSRLGTTPGQSRRSCDAIDRVRSGSKGLRLGCLALGLALGVGCSSSGRPAPAGQGGGPQTGAGGNSGSVSTSLGGSAQAGSAGAAGTAGSASTSEAGASGAGDAAGAGGASFAPSCIPGQECQNLCGTLGNDPAACGLGNIEQCGCVCEERFAGPCPDLLAALLACTGNSPNIDCKQRGRIFEGCESQSLALEVCDFRAREQLCAQDYPRCMTFCQAAVLSFCAEGPESLGSCLCGCEETFVASCAAEFDAFMNCTADTPAFSCDANGHNQSTSCAAEWQALKACQSAGVPDAG